MDKESRFSPKVEAVVQTFIEKLSPFEEVLEIYLFGSYAYGTPTADSDFDFAVISNDTNTRILHLMRKYRKQVKSHIDEPLDLLVYYPETFQERADTGLLMESTIREEGVKIYEKGRYH